MFKCLDSRTDGEIVIIDEERKDDSLAALRAKGRADVLLCPQCRQPVLVKAGVLKAWHFAHRDLGSCPLQNESQAVLHARGLLYRWLRAKFVERPGLDASGQASITVEKQLDNNLPRPADCYVEFPDRRSVAYWIFEKGMRDREALLAGLSGVSLRPVFLKSMLRPVENWKWGFDLTPTERDFIVRTKYDTVHGTSGGSLHYLDEEAGTLTTLRGLRLVHRPQRHLAEVVRSHPLSEVLATKAGEFVHPGEHAELQKHQEKQRELLRRKQEQKRLEKEHVRQLRQQTRASVRRHQEQVRGPRVPLVREDPPQWVPRATGRADPSPVVREEPAKHSPPVAATQSDPPPPEESLIRRRLRGKEPMTCEVCGLKTTDWVMCTAAAGTCICRECLLKRHGAKEGGT